MVDSLFTHILLKGPAVEIFLLRRLFDGLASGNGNW